MIMSKQSVARDPPLSEVTLRKYGKPDTNDRELVRKTCLSLGLLQPGDSRDVIVDVLQVLLEARSEEETLTSKEIRELVIENREDNDLPVKGTASSNIRRQLRRLKDALIIESISNEYRIREFMSLKEIFEEQYEEYLLRSILDRVKDYMSAVDKEF